ncbi:MAG TPA: hypothetical protein VLA60_16510 [Nitrospirales bacterium]|nr:hypothetical protein [Nitrospirales bacterium]
MVLRRALVRGLQPYKARVHILTYYEGLEFSEQVGIAQDLEAQIYFARPYGS